MKPGGGEDVEKEIKSLLHETISKLQLGGAAKGAKARHQFSQSA